MSDQIKSVRRFNRFYTNVLGLLDEKLYAPHATLTEARVLWELSEQKQATATMLINTLRLDRGYLSRVLDKLVRRELVERKTGPEDKRVKLLSLSPKGKKLLGTLARESSGQVRQMLDGLDDGQRTELVWAMERIETILKENRKGA